ncbi:MAG: hypothetical protein IH602_18820 [Bryobacteraceae bacterium]|nr:hypothetical protein [Bryobacteraceae bacterium]
MENEAQPPVQPDDPIRREQDLARDQIAAAWQIHIERVQESLESGWRGHVEQVLNERLQAVSTVAAAEVERQVAERLTAEIANQRAHLSRQITERLNQTARRLEQAEDSAQWSAALLDGANGFAANVALFSALSGELKHEGHRLAPSEEIPLTSFEDLRVPLDQVPAAGTVLESLDTVIAMAAPGDLSESLAAPLNSAGASRVCLVPLVVGRASNERRAVAILIAWDGGEPLDVSVLELLCTLAGSTLDTTFDRRQSASSATAGQVVSITPIQQPAKPVSAAEAFDALPREDQELHSRAQRFARVRVAEMRLYQPDHVRKGRENACLYTALRGEMDRSRAQFKHEFMSIPSMVDYFHVEVIRTLANDDESLLGPEYPGSLC